MANPDHLALLLGEVTSWNASRTQIQAFRPDLMSADLGGADLTEANLREANLREANLAEADLRGANLRWADLNETDLGRAYLSLVDFTRADLRGANLRGADLAGTILTHADLRGADLSEANLAGANLEGCLHDSSTVWPDGFNPRRSLQRSEDRELDLPVTATVDSVWALPAAPLVRVAEVTDPDTIQRLRERVESLEPEYRAKIEDLIASDTRAGKTRGWDADLTLEALTRLVRQSSPDPLSVTRQLSLFFSQVDAFDESFADKLAKPFGDDTAPFKDFSTILQDEIRGFGAEDSQVAGNHAARIAQGIENIPSEAIFKKRTPEEFVQDLTDDEVLRVSRSSGLVPTNPHSENGGNASEGGRDPDATKRQRREDLVLGIMGVDLAINAEPAARYAAKAVFYSLSSNTTRLIWDIIRLLFKTIS